MSFSEIDKLQNEFVDAAEKGNKPRVFNLLLKGVDINRKIENGFSALLTAAQNGHADIVRFLISVGADINDKHPFSGSNALISAAINDQPDVVNVILNAGAKVNEIDNLGYTALHVATSFAKEEIVSNLIKHGCSVNAANNLGETPLHLYYANDNLPIVRLLVKNGANVNAIDNNGETPLHNASFYNNLKIVRFLLDNGANREIINKNGKTAFDVAKLAQHGTDGLAYILKYYNPGVASPLDYNLVKDRDSLYLELSVVKSQLAYKDEEIMELKKKLSEFDGLRQTQMMEINIKLDEFKNQMNQQGLIQKESMKIFQLETRSMMDRLATEEKRRVCETEEHFKTFTKTKMSLDRMAKETKSRFEELNTRLAEIERTKIETTSSQLLEVQATVHRNRNIEFEFEEKIEKLAKTLTSVEIQMRHLQIAVTHQISTLARDICELRVKVQAES